MKRIFALVLGLGLLAGCGAAARGEPETTTASHTKWPEPIPALAPTNSDGRERFPCVASLPEDDIYLYWIRGSRNRGRMVLFQEDQETVFDDWGYEKYNYPKLAYSDFDGDGKKEIAVITIVGSGTGILLTDLHILKVEKKYVPNVTEISYEEFTFTNEEAASIIDNKLSCKQGTQPGTLELTLDGKRHLITLDKGETWREDGGVSVEPHIEFMFEGEGIHINAGVSTFVEEVPWNTYIADITANATFDGKEFHITNIDFEPTQERKHERYTR